MFPQVCESPPPLTPGHQVCPHPSPWLRGILPSRQVLRSTSPRSSMSLSPRAGQLFPSGRRARAARGPRAPVPVAILAAGQGLGGSDVLSRAEEAGHVADYKGGGDDSSGGRAILEPTPQSRESEITSGVVPRGRSRGSDVSARRWCDGAPAAAPAAEECEWEPGGFRTLRSRAPLSARREPQIAWDLGLGLPAGVRRPGKLVVARHRVERWAPLPLNPLSPCLQLRDFLLVYNRMTELCFERCVPSLLHRALDAEEVSWGTGRALPLIRSQPQTASLLPLPCLRPWPFRDPRPLGGDGKEGDGHDRTPLAPASTLSFFQEACLHSCAGKLIHSNHRLMAAYVQLMPALVHRRIADYEAASAGPGVTAEQTGTSAPGS